MYHVKRMESKEELKPTQLDRFKAFFDAEGVECWVEYDNHCPYLVVYYGDNYNGEVGSGNVNAMYFEFNEQKNLIYRGVVMCRKCGKNNYKWMHEKSKHKTRTLNYKFSILNTGLYPEYNGCRCKSPEDRNGNLIK